MVGVVTSLQLTWYVRLQVAAEALVDLTHMYTFCEAISDKDLMVVALRVNESKSMKVSGSHTVAGCA